MGRGGLGIGTIAILGIIGYALGIDPRLLIGGAELLSGGGQQQTRSQPSGKTGAPSDDMGKFVARVLGSTEVQWKQVFEQAGQRYQNPQLVMFNGATRADACGQRSEERRVGKEGRCAGWPEDEKGEMTERG